MTYMPTRLNEEAIKLIEGKNFAFLATIGVERAQV
jgi:hypothetical protein